MLLQSVGTCNNILITMSNTLMRWQRTSKNNPGYKEVGYLHGKALK